MLDINVLTLCFLRFSLQEIVRQAASRVCLRRAQEREVTEARENLPTLEGK